MYSGLVEDVGCVGFYGSGDVGFGALSHTRHP